MWWILFLNEAAGCRLVVLLRRYFDTVVFFSILRISFKTHFFCKTPASSSFKNLKGTSNKFEASVKQIWSQSETKLKQTGNKFEANLKQIRSKCERNLKRVLNVIETNWKPSKNLKRTYTINVLCGANRNEF